MLINIKNCSNNVNIVMIKEVYLIRTNFRAEKFLRTSSAQNQKFADLFSRTFLLNSKLLAVKSFFVLLFFNVKFENFRAD